MRVQPFTCIWNLDGYFVNEKVVSERLKYACERRGVYVSWWWCVYDTEGGYFLQVEVIYYRDHIRELACRLYI